MPSWVSAGCDDYSKRLPREYAFEMVEIPLGQRVKGQPPGKAVQQESEAMLAQIDARDWVIALEVAGASWSTEALAAHLGRWQMDGRNLVFMIGGPDGLGPACRQRANQQWSLSALTLPHPVVRIVLVEQLYRAWSILNHHPYHRA
jgi:23S rRNA (pseudouridine1915-N3)-methyltransferase